MDPFEQLPVEIIEKILLFLDEKSLKACSLVNDKWHNLTNNNKLWKNICDMKGWSDIGSLNYQTKCFKFLNESGHREIFSNLCEWKKHYVLRKQYLFNLQTGKYMDYFIEPLNVEIFNILGNVDVEISAVSSGSDNFVAVGYFCGIFTLYKLKDDTYNFVTMEKCVFLHSPVHFLKIINDFIIICQKNLIQIYKIDVEGVILELTAVKILQNDTIIDVEISLLLLDDISFIYEFTGTEAVTIVDPLIHVNEEHLILTTTSLKHISVFTYQNNFTDPITIWNETDTDSINLLDRDVFTIFYGDDDVHILLRLDDTFEDDDRFNAELFSLYLLDLKTEKLSFNTFLPNNEFIKNSFKCIIETNAYFRVFNFDQDYFYLFSKKENILLIQDSGNIFLNAYSDLYSVGICRDNNFDIIDLRTFQCIYSFQMEGIPVVLISDVLVTYANEFSKTGDHFEVTEFWYINKTVENVGSIKFKNKFRTGYITLNFPAIFYGGRSGGFLCMDSIKMIFYTNEKKLLLRHFIG